MKFDQAENFGYGSSLVSYNMANAWYADRIYDAYNHQRQQDWAQKYFLSQQSLQQQTWQLNTACEFDSGDETISSAGSSWTPEDMDLGYSYHGSTPSSMPDMSRWPSCSDTVSEASASSEPPQTSSHATKGLSPSTEVDSLMLTIQHKAPSASAATSHPRSSSIDIHRVTKPKRHLCPFSDCIKAFGQKTHLDIHIRAHTGEKPFTCSFPGCGQSFSQQGNLRTHERRHTGERPYSCDKCGKSFAQRGNWRAHRLAVVCSADDEDLEEKLDKRNRFVCRLGGCMGQGGKWFTQLGNLKSHQNKYHSDDLYQLKEKFSWAASFGQMDSLCPEDQELWDYFSGLYKNCNKGIKGRGKGRRVDVVRTPSS